jgi:hypothetical protein
MKLEELRTYYRLREYQISHLLNARKCHGYGRHAEFNMYLFLLFWADAKHQADDMLRRPDFAAASMQSRGLT